ncbi:ABC-three component system middle component 6 [Gimesia aquarii]|uniref:Uncharacterized protein n=1 Tax=Gimesia aquarii TaxID=2527964 RepID=A0A517VTC1_9PLAN|nr:ABC-three component system middle component 6 [Gimesia aquarii]QDT96264.1 hypothetical protein V144x_17180 [Gimesia aquarii]
MIISKDIKPERQIYRLGAMLLEVLQGTSGSVIELFDLYQLVNRQETISLNAFFITVDWLFLLGAITNDKGRIVKCF